MSNPSFELPSLTQNAIFQMAQTLQNVSQTECQQAFKPILQLIHYSILKGAVGTSSSSKVILNDGNHFLSCMIVGVNAITSLDLFCYVRVNDYIVRTIENRIITIIKSIEVIHPSILGQHSIGNPIDFEKTNLLTDIINKYNNTTNQQHQQQQPLLLNQPQAHTIPSDTPPKLKWTPIAALHLRLATWIIKGRITDKSDMKHYSNDRGDGFLFNIKILDEASSDIRGAFFNETAEKFYNKLDVTKVYTFTGGRLKQGNKAYNKCSCPYEITFDQSTKIELAQDEGLISPQRYNFIRSISDIKTLEENATIDLVAIVKYVSDCSKVTTRTGKDVLKCDLTLIDQSNTEICLTLWEKAAEKASTLYAKQPAVAIRQAKVSKYNSSVSLKSNDMSGGIDINTIFIQEATNLLCWWMLHKKDKNTSPSRTLSMNNSKMDNHFEVLYDRSDIFAIKENNIGNMNNGAGDFLTFKGYCISIKNSKETGDWYEACPNEKECYNAKVLLTTDGTWECPKCFQRYPKPVLRWIFTALLKDSTSETWVTFFNEAAELLLEGTTADAANILACANDNNFDVEIYKSIFLKGLYREFYFKCKVKSEINPHTNEARIKTTVVSIGKIDYQKESLQLLSFLE